ncbi:MAG: hypothetical protein IKV94_06040 [Clostridia bacterium]|nr:hypothetical protein [Clostridia bacterium]
MNNFNVNISVSDCCSSKCCNSNKETTKIITSTADFISLQNCYYIRVLSATSTYVLLEITNGTIHFIRKAFLNIPFNLCLSENCPVHRIIILVNSITLR